MSATLRQRIANRTANKRSRTKRESDLQSDLIRLTKLRSSYANASSYILKIHLQTNATGKHSFVFENKMLKNPPRVASVPSVYALEQQALTKYPRVPRKQGVAPYGERIKKNRDPRKSNKEWDKLSEEISKKLSKSFKNGTYLRIANPLYPNRTSRDVVFRIRSYDWLSCTRPVCTARWTNARDGEAQTSAFPGDLSQGGYKFIITPVQLDFSIPSRPPARAAAVPRTRHELVVNIRVKLYGTVDKDLHRIPPRTRKLALQPTAGIRGAIQSGCANRLENLKQVYQSLFALDDSAGFADKLERRRREEAASAARKVAAVRRIQQLTRKRKSRGGRRKRTRGRRRKARRRKARRRHTRRRMRHRGGGERCGNIQCDMLDLEQHGDGGNDICSRARCGTCAVDQQKKIKVHEERERFDRAFARLDHAENAREETEREYRAAEERHNEATERAEEATREAEESLEASEAAERAAVGTCVQLGGNRGKTRRA